LYYPEVALVVFQAKIGLQQAGFLGAHHVKLIGLAGGQLDGKFLVVAPVAQARVHGIALRQQVAVVEDKNRGFRESFRFTNKIRPANPHLPVVRLDHHVRGAFGQPGAGDLRLVELMVRHSQQQLRPHRSPLTLGFDGLFQHAGRGGKVSGPVVSGTKGFKK
jgi:hypothetical protein